MTEQFNIANRLSITAQKMPHQRAVIFPAGHDSSGRVAYTHLTFKQLDEESDRLARGLARMGVVPGTKMVLMVKPSLEFIAWTFALFKSGAIVILIDPGMGRTNIFNCLEEVEPDGFVGIPIVQFIRIVSRSRFPKARFNVTVGKRWLWSGPNHQDMLGEPWTPFEMPLMKSEDSAAVIFTSGSTGPPKGVLYEHGMFNAQVDLLQSFYGIEPGEIDLPGFPLFALFNSAMGVTTLIPDMDPTKPATVDAEKIVTAMHDQGVTQAFGSPAMWNRIGRYCEEHRIQFPTLRRVLSAGAPVPPHVLTRMRKTLVLPGADINTPYGATESLPVCSINGKTVLEKTAEKTKTGAGTCVGKPFDGVDVKIIQITDAPIASWNDANQLPAGEIGEVTVKGPMATREYYNRPEATAAAKIPDGKTFWHRMGDVGYLDEEGALWFCGRKTHMVHAANGPMFSIPCEAIFNEHQSLYRSALVGIGERGSQTPVIIAEPEAGQFPETEAAKKKLTEELLELGSGNPLTTEIKTVLFHRSLPVDTRHNVKIKRELLAPWAAKVLK